VRGPHLPTPLPGEGQGICACPPSPRRAMGVCARPPPAPRVGGGGCGSPLGRPRVPAPTPSPRSSSLPSPSAWTGWTAKTSASDPTSWSRRSPRCRRVRAPRGSPPGGSQQQQGRVPAGPAAGWPGIPAPCHRRGDVCSGTGGWAATGPQGLATASSGPAARTAAPGRGAGGPEQPRGTGGVPMPPACPCWEHALGLSRASRRLPGASLLCVLQ